MLKIHPQASFTRGYFFQNLQVCSSKARLGCETRDLTQTTMLTATRTSLKNSFNEQYNGSARALLFFVYFFLIPILVPRALNPFGQHSLCFPLSTALLLLVMAKLSGETSAGVLNGGRTNSPQETIWGVGPLLRTRREAGRHFVPSNGPTSDCEMRRTPDCFSFRMRRMKSGRTSQSNYRET